MALVRLLQIEEPMTEVTLAVALSLALDALVAGTMLYTGVWSPPWGLMLLICISVVGVTLQFVIEGASAVVLPVGIVTRRVRLPWGQSPPLGEGRSPSGQPPPEEAD
jgi:hypothetical protein